MTIDEAVLRAEWKRGEDAKRELLGVLNEQITEVAKRLDDLRSQRDELRGIRRGGRQPGDGVPTQAKIVAAIEAGNTGVAAIARAAGLSYQQAATCLCRLVRRGRVDRPAHGFYVMPGAT